MGVNIAAIDAQHQRVSIVTQALKSAERSFDRTADLNLDGEKKAMTYAELNTFLDAETEKLRQLGPTF